MSVYQSFDISVPMDKETLQEQIDVAAARYVGKRDPTVREEMVSLCLRLAEFEHLTLLEKTVERFRSEDVRKPELKQALKNLAEVMPDSRPIKQMFDALAIENEVRRCQLVKEALAAIRLCVMG